MLTDEFLTYATTPRKNGTPAGELLRYCLNDASAMWAQTGASENPHGGYLKSTKTDKGIIEIHADEQRKALEYLKVTTIRPDQFSVVSWNDNFAANKAFLA